MHLTKWLPNYIPDATHSFLVSDESIDMEYICLWKNNSPVTNLKGICLVSSKTTLVCI
jgi:hypothetical protein